MGGRYTDAQLNSCFKKVKVKLEKEKSWMNRLAEAGENILLLDVMKKRKKRRDIVEKVNKEFSHTWTWRKRKIEKRKVKVSKDDIAKDDKKVKDTNRKTWKRVLVTTLLSIFMAYIVYCFIVFWCRDDISTFFFIFFCALGLYLSLMWMNKR